MFEKIKTAFLLAGEFRGVIFELLGSPLESARLASTLMELKDKFAQGDKVKAGFEALEILLKLKNENPNDFKALMTHLENALEIYKKDPGGVGEKIKKLLDN